MAIGRLKITETPGTVEKGKTLGKAKNKRAIPNARLPRASEYPDRSDYPLSIYFAQFQEGSLKSVYQAFYPVHLS